MRNFLPVLTLVVLIAVTGCQKDEIQIDKTPASSFDYKTPLIWNQMYLKIERYTPGYIPPVSARNYAMIQLAAYESIVHGSAGKYKSFSGYYPGLEIDLPEQGEEYNWEACLNAAYEKAFELYYPLAPSEQQFEMLNMRTGMRSEMQSKMESSVYQRSVEYGHRVAQAVYDWSAEDTWAHEAYLHNTDPTYVPPSGQGKWQPTYPDYAPALLPNWGNVSTFAATENDVVPAPPIFSLDPNSQLYKEAVEVQETVNDIRAGQKEEDYWIAEFWSDDCPILTFTPAGRWVSITNQVIAIERPDMLESVVTYAKIGMALSDSGVKCWQEKYKYNLLRPIDYIRNHLGDPNWNTLMCPDGSGNYYTPPFPAYPSGHATFGAAAAMVLADIYGSNYRLTDRSHEGRTEFKSRPRTFQSFTEMAMENAHSRIPLGVHFEVDALAGVQLGFAIGTKVNHLPWR